MYLVRNAYAHIRISHTSHIRTISVAQNTSTLPEGATNKDVGILITGKKTMVSERKYHTYDAMNVEM